MELAFVAVVSMWFADAAAGSTQFGGLLRGQPGTTPASMICLRRNEHRTDSETSRSRAT